MPSDAIRSVLKQYRCLSHSPKLKVLPPIGLLIPSLVSCRSICCAIHVKQGHTQSYSVSTWGYASQQRQETRFIHLRSARASSQLARAIASRPGTSAETYVAYGLTQKLFEVCSSQADYTIPQLDKKGGQVPKTDAGEDLGVGQGWWYKELGLLPTFSTWSQVTFLHMYLLTARLRALPSPESLQTYSQHLIDHFSHDAEHRMDVLHGLTSRAIRNKFLKDLFIQWRGALAAYDEGVIKGDAVLGAAIWRNLWKASHTAPDGEDMDWTKVALVVAYMRRVLHDLSHVNEADLALRLGRNDGGRPSIFSVSQAEKKLVYG
ncbi:uncharacterized protein BP01DRAFT_359980 [Aspergillus saccharolyticus JOP 1030-1]|uniref:Ubiquinol-cytochrome c chaperone domain-containing protein n=1 Tax=Aspergillus saccharolyticus JOP 1030-1 TaxID=1450539 RepID=A0A318Z674_9EURO|nr:hypothetical protein BP01DRAFT_359980 [Aspergillus saccharolyticus JOP 1030-1]PYH41887.1 hypothetical protein BP01DRAFT_359980 [Aspergillus saccharolyticus JOP 1030-1]